MARLMERNLTKKRKKMMNKPWQLAAMAGDEEVASSSVPFSDILVLNDSAGATCLVPLRVGQTIVFAVALDD